MQEFSRLKESISNQGGIMSISGIMESQLRKNNISSLPYNLHQNWRYKWGKNNPSASRKQVKLFYNHGLKMTGLNIQYDKISKAINKNIYKCNYIQIGFYFFYFLQIGFLILQSENHSGCLLRVRMRVRDEEKMWHSHCGNAKWYLRINSDEKPQMGKNIIAHSYVFPQQYSSMQV